MHNSANRLGRSNVEHTRLIQSDVVFRILLVTDQPEYPSSLLGIAFSLFCAHVYDTSSRFIFWNYSMDIRMYEYGRLKSKSQYKRHADQTDLPVDRSYILQSFSFLALGGFSLSLRPSLHIFFYRLGLL